MLIFVRVIFATLYLYFASLLVGLGSNFYALAVIFIALPLILSWFYRITVAKKAWLIKISDDAVAKSIISSRFVSYSLTFIIAITLSSFVSISFYKLQNIDWLIFIFATVPTYFIFSKIFQIFAKRQYKTEYRNDFSLTKLGFVSVVSATIFVIISYLLGRYNFHYASFYEAIESLDLNYKINDENIAYPIFRFILLKDMALEYFLASQAKYSWIIATFIFDSLSSLFLVSTIHAFLLSSKDISSIFIPIYNPKNIKVYQSKPLFVSIFIFTLFMIFLYLPSIRYLSELGFYKDTLKKYDAFEKDMVEVIETGKCYYEKSILGNTEYIRKESLMKISEQEKVINETFNEIISNVDNYLDWYYSILGGYERLFKVLNFQEYLKDKFNSLVIKDSEARLSERLSAIGFDYGKIKDETLSIIENSLSVKCSKNAYKVNLDDILAGNFKNAKDISEFGASRAINIGGKIVGAGVSSALLVKVFAKPLSSKAISLLAAFGAKQVVSKTAATLGAAGFCAAGGAAIGSFVPIVGTAAGAIAGGVACAIGAGFAVDAAVNKADELLNRADYKKEIIDAIEEARQETLKGMDFHE